MTYRKYYMQSGRDMQTGKVMSRELGAGSLERVTWRCFPCNREPRTVREKFCAASDVRNGKQITDGG